MMGGYSSITVKGVEIRYGDWVRYTDHHGVTRDYTFFEMTEDMDIMLRDDRYDWEFVRVDRGDFDFGAAVFVCHRDDERFAIGNWI